VTLRFVATRASAIVPILMSIAALAVLALALSTGFGVSSDGDEGTAAHLWQLLIAAQIPIIGYFALRWMSVAPRGGLVVFAARIGAGIAATIPVFLLHL
jgi:hypothetical protein